MGKKIQWLEKWGKKCSDCFQVFHLDTKKLHMNLQLGVIVNVSAREGERERNYMKIRHYSNISGTIKMSMKLCNCKLIHIKLNRFRNKYLMLKLIYGKINTTKIEKQRLLTIIPRFM